MPAVSAIIQHGTLPTSSLTDESSLLIQSVTFNSTRDRKDYVGADGTVGAIEYRNPQFTIVIDGFVTAYSGITTLNAGEEVTSIDNFGSSVLGHAPGDGVLTIEDPTVTQSNSEADKFGCTIRQSAFVA